jgi:hypothetical protein
MFCLTSYLYYIFIPSECCLSPRSLFALNIDCGEMCNVGGVGEQSTYLNRHHLYSFFPWFQCRLLLERLPVHIPAIYVIALLKVSVFSSFCPSECRCMRTWKRILPPPPKFSYCVLGHLWSFLHINSPSSSFFFSETAHLCSWYCLKNCFCCSSLTWNCIVRNMCHVFFREMETLIIRSNSFWRSYRCTNIMFSDIIHRLVFI